MATNSSLLINKTGKSINALYLYTNDLTQYKSSDIKSIPCVTTDTINAPASNQTIAYGANGKSGIILAWDPDGGYGGYVDLSVAVANGLASDNTWLGIYAYNDTTQAIATPLYCDQTAIDETPTVDKNTIVLEPLDTFTLPDGVTINDDGSITIGTVTYQTPKSKANPDSPTFSISFSLVALIIILIVLAALGGIAFWYYKKHKKGM